MRINLTKKDLVNLVYMQLGFSKQISENLIEDFLSTISSNIKNEKKLPTLKSDGNDEKQLEKVEISSSEFSEIVEKITKKNTFKPYPDINDIPN